jgi:hypothetical protein
MSDYERATVFDPGEGIYYHLETSPRMGFGVALNRVGDEVWINGWYDHKRGIGEVRVPVAEFITALNLTETALALLINKGETK